MTAGALIGDGLARGDDLLGATDRAVAAALAPLGTVRPDLACVFVSGGSPDAAASALARASETVGARNVVGCTANGVIAAGCGVEGAPGVSVWAASLPSVEVRAFHLEVLRTSDAIAVLGMPDRQRDDVVGLMLADPWSFPVDGFLEHSRSALGGLPIVGGLASGAAAGGDTRLLVDGRVHDRGAVGVVLGGRVAVHTLVSQGCRPIGQPFTVTRADGATVMELAGRPALERAKEAVGSLPAEEQPLAIRGLALGVVVDEYADEYVAGDFVARGIVAADHMTGWLTAGDVIGVGTTVQFLLRDPVSARDDLTGVLSAFRRRIGLEPLAGALLFAADSRGRVMSPDHDVAAVRDELGLPSVAGFFAAGEIGPLRGRNLVHGSTATLLAFGT